MQNDYVRSYQRRFWGTRHARLKTLSALVMGALIILFIGVVGVGATFIWYAKDLPRPDKITRTQGLSTVILDRYGENLYNIFEDENRIAVQWQEIPQYCRDATIAIEDKEFYRHPGLSTSGIIRAVVNIFVFHNFQGGSTLTQQLVKNVLLTQERTLPRKIKEAMLAIQIERKYTKDEILLMYLNETPYGGTAVGIEAASQYYFGKPVSKLGLVECSVLAGFPQSPSRYSPFTGEQTAYIWRTEQVLRRMREDGYISSSQEEEVKKRLPSVSFSDSNVGLRAPHFVAYVKELLTQKFGSKIFDQGGLTVTTTLDSKLQDKVQKIVAEEVEKASKLKVSNGAAVVLDSTNGQILAMVGSKDYQASESGGYKYNVVVQGLRQPGSALKPITYAVALKKGYTASTVLMDVETKYPSGDSKKPDYNPKNYDGKYRGPIQLRYALANSINTIAVKVSALVGIQDILKTAYEMGLSTLEPTDENIRRFGLSLTLGGGEVTLLDLTSAYSVFSTGGLRNEPIAILKIEDNKGKVLYEFKEPNPKRVLSEEISYIISNILSDNDARKLVFGERSYLVISGKTTAVKTGTTDDKRDNWTVGYSKSRVAGVWVGNNDNSPMHPSLASGLTGAAPIWNRIMKDVLEDISNEPFVRPSSVNEIEIDAYGGGLPFNDYPKRKELYIAGTEPTGPSIIYQQIKMSRHDSNKRANSVEISQGAYDTKTFVVFSEKDPVSTDGKNRWQEGIDSWIAAQGDAKYHPPTETYSEGEKIAVNITKPEEMSQSNTNIVELRATGVSIYDIVRIEFFLDGSKLKEYIGKEVSDTASIPNGSHVLKFKVFDAQGNSAEKEIHMGINEPYSTPTQAPTPTNTP